MLFQPTIAGQMSGSFGALTFSHNKGGTYVRMRSIPTDPASIFQVPLRNNMSVLATRWSETLTQVQRDAWNVYADNVPRPNALGQLRFISGIAHYVRSNTVRLQIDPLGIVLPIVDDAPTIFDLGSFTEPTLAVTGGTTVALVTFGQTDAWVSEDDSALLLFTSRPVSPSITFFKGPYRSSLGIFGQVAIPPTTPQVVATSFVIPLNTAFYVRANVTRADGRLGAPVRFRGAVNP